jgi:hypothetical protein
MKIDEDVTRLARAWADAELEDLARRGQADVLAKELCAAARAWAEVVRAERELTDDQARHVYVTHDYMCLVARRFDEASLAAVAAPEATFATTSVLDETHDFQRFERVFLNRTKGHDSGELKIVCRCGWTSISIDRDPDEAVAIGAARDLLQEHVTSAVARAKKSVCPRCGDSGVLKYATSGVEPFAALWDPARIFCDCPAGQARR